MKKTLGLMAITAAAALIALAGSGCDPSDSYELAPIAATGGAPTDTTTLNCAFVWPDFNGDCDCTRTADPKTNEDRNGDGLCTLFDYEGKDGVSCSVATNASLCAVITCGTTVSSPLCAPRGCTVTKSGTVYTMSCADGTTASWSDGAVGPQGPQGPKGDKGDTGASGANGHDACFKSTVEPDGVNCQYGGHRIDFGTDLNNSGGVCEATEITSTYYNCDGADAFNWLCLNSTIITNATCPDGGVLAECGLDTNRDGDLGLTEVTSRYDICDGADGQTCVPVDVPNGCIFVQCGSLVSNPVCPGRDGTDGTDGSNGTNGTSCSGAQDPVTKCVTITCGTTAFAPICPCVVSNPAAGTYTMTCPNGTQTWHDGQQGPAGTNGTGCTVAQTNNVCTITCGTTSESWACGAAQVPSYDNDADCRCETAPCSGSVNQLCTTLVGGDCNDSITGARLLGCYLASTSDLQVRPFAQGCPVNYDLIFLTGDGYAVHPGATEVLDGVDNNCDGHIDEGFCTANADCSGLTPFCQLPLGVCVPCLVAGDCDDANPCTIDTCTAGACGHTNAADQTPCADALFCNGPEACVAGVCTDQADPCLTPQTCDEATDACVGAPTDPTRWDWDGDGYCGSKTQTCIGSANPIWTVAQLKQNDCDDTPNSGSSPAVWCKGADGKQYLLVNFAVGATTRPTCEAGASLLLNTDGSALNNPAMHESIDGFDNNCNGSIDEAGTVDVCSWASLGSGVWKVVCPFMNP